MEIILGQLNNITPLAETRDDMYGDINYYFEAYYNSQGWWAAKLVICNALNLVNILINVFLVDWYLDGQFFGYGIVSLR